MVQIVSGAEAQAKVRKRTVVGDLEFWKTEYLGPSSTPGTFVAAPPLAQRHAQGFLIEQAAGSVIPAHFHKVNQFQVVVQGNGTLGRYSVERGAVHYAGGYTGYGPIRAGEHGLAYLTLRAQFDFNAYFLPQSRSELKDVERQFLLARDVRLSDPSELAERSGAALEVILTPQESGLAGYLARLGPEALLDLIAPDTGGGQYWLVMAGGIRHSEKDLTQRSCLFIAPTDPYFAMRAGSSGAEVLVLQYPRNPEPRPKSPAAGSLLQPASI